MSTDFTGDLLDGVKAIANFTGLDRRAVYHMARTGKMPGVFRAGRKWLGIKSEIEAGFRDRARNAVKEEHMTANRERSSARR